VPQVNAPLGIASVTSNSTTKGSLVDSPFQGDGVQPRAHVVLQPLGMASQAPHDDLEDAGLTCVVPLAAKSPEARTEALVEG